MDITFYTNNSGRIVADKDLTALATATGQFRTTADVLRPTFTCSATSASAACDYAYITELGRYYYVIDRKYITTELIELTLETDLRMTFKEALQTMEGIVERNENNYNMYLEDANIPASIKRVTTVRKIGTPFTGTPINIMIVAGGK